jgi:hypothetical protein
VTDQNLDSRQRTRATRVGSIWVFAVTVIGIGWAIGWKFFWHNPAPAQKTFDPSIVISTFITLYGLFLTGFGILVGLLTAKKDARRIWKPVAIVFLIGGALIDLWRVLDSTNDLYKAATHGLTYHALYDTVHDFFAYFVLNVFVVIFAVLATCLPPGPSITPKTIWEQIRDWGHRLVIQDRATTAWRSGSHTGSESADPQVSQSAGAGNAAPQSSQAAATEQQRHRTASDLDAPE